MTVSMFGWVGDLVQDLEAGGDHSTGELLERLMAGTRNESTAEIEATVPALLATARARGLPWLELYARHWELQHRIFDRREGGTAVRRAVEAFELAHRPEARGCPQAVCITQDLAAAYGQADGPGYAEERIAASTETLGRIGPEWPCFDCISSEWQDALLDAGRPAESLTAGDEAEAALRGAGQEVSIGIPTQRVEALLALGDPGAAATVAGKAKDAGYAVHHPTQTQVLALLEAVAWARLGRSDEALARLSTIIDPLEHPRASGAWRDLAMELLDQGLADPGSVQATLRDLARLHRDRDAHRFAFSLFVDVARLASASGELVEARAARNQAVAAMARLARPVDAPGLLGRLDADLAAAEARGPTEDDEGLDALDAARRAEPDDVGPTLALALTLYRRGWDDEALGLLAERMASHPDEEAPVGFTIDLLLDRGEVDAAEALASKVQVAHPVMATLTRARVAAVRGAWGDVIELCAEVVALEPKAVRTRRLWSVAERQLGDVAAAARLLEEILDLGVEDPDLIEDGDRWEAIVAASAAERWDLVRRAGAELGMELAGDVGPVDERWGGVLVTFLEDDGREVTEVAMRTGPATAVVSSVAWPGQVRAGDRVVFDPKPLDPVPEDPEEQDDRLVRFAHVATLSRGEMRSWPLIGVWPGDDRWAAFREGMDAAGGATWVFDEPEPWAHPELGQVERLYAHVAVPHPLPPAEASALLSRLSDGWPLVAWPELAADAGEDPAAHEQRLADW